MYTLINHRVFHLIIANTLIGLILFSVSFNENSDNFIKELVRLQLNIHTISLITFFSVSAFYKKLQQQSPVKRFFYSWPVGILSSFLAIIPITLMHMLLDGSGLNDLLRQMSLSKTFFPVFLLSSIYMIVTFRIDYLAAERDSLQVTVNSIKDGKNAASTIIMKQNGTTYKIQTDKIVYISSHGHWTVLHGEEKDFQSKVPVKELEMKLSSSGFVRVHKSYIAAVKFISHIKYSKGGSYTVFLSDNEDTSLPVGRKYIHELRNLIGNN